MGRFSVEIDEASGFCSGVVRAINKAESVIDEGKSLISLGAIVHNEAEISRLEKKGMRTVADLDGLRNETVLIRAHGEPPITYRRAEEQQLEIIDCTCPVVLQLQKRIKKKYNEIAPTGGQIVIYGKKGHAEVNGLIGQVDSQAVVVDKVSDLDKGEIAYTRESALFSQTTKEPVCYQEIIEEIRKRILNAKADPELLNVNNTICAQVSSRHPKLKRFASEHDVIVFVSGRESSNGKVLHGVCREVNPNSYKVESAAEIRKEWFEGVTSVGICGATSTPKWQLFDIAEYIKSFY